MGKLHVAHRVVTRDPRDRITSDDPHDDFPAALEAFDALTPKPGEEITLQHGARILRRKSG
ncbi:MAG: hypothetical protein IE938_21465 [Pseudomonas balearica]|nr:hypothetical protein [Thioclava sp.]MBD3739006.1 hypothetical protein [Stutzerimonas balearica]MBD3805232.1 hypothetical protein [Thioclava sp.]